MFHDDGRFMQKMEKGRNFPLFKTFSTDGGLTWNKPQTVFKSSGIHLCEAVLIRSPSGKKSPFYYAKIRGRKFTHHFSEGKGVKHGLYHENFLFP